MRIVCVSSRPPARPALALALAGALCALAAASPAAAATLTFTPVADAYVRSDTPSTNFGTAKELRARGGGSLVISSYLKFTVFGAPTVSQATLRVFVTDPSPVAGSVYRVPDTTWTETGITYSNAPLPTGGALDTEPAAATAGTWVELEVSAAVAGDGTYTLQLQSTVSDAVFYSSRQGSNPPQLVVQTGSGGGTAPTADFTASPTSGAAPLTVAFTDTSTGDPTSWAWDFQNDGLVDSTARNPQFTYTSTGSYTVELSVTNASGSDSEVKASFVTVGSAAGAVTVMATGDIACDPSHPSFNGGNGTALECRQRYTSDLLVAGGPDAVLPLGDLQYENGELPDFQASYDPSWGRLYSRTYPATGNHEYNTPGASGYFAYWGSRAGDPSKGYYSFDLGAWHVVALNSNCSQVGGCGAGSAQEQWLRADLAAHPTTCTLAYWHHARFNGGAIAGGTKALWQALYDNGADVVLNGHYHNYQRFAPQKPSGAADPARGIRQFVVGTGGRNHSGVTPGGNLQVYDTQTFGVLKLVLRAAGYDWQFLPEAGASFTDSGSTSCH